MQDDKEKKCSMIHHVSVHNGTDKSQGALYGLHGGELP